VKKIRDYILKGKEIFVGLEDSKKSWKVCIRSGKIIVSETSMPARYDNFRNYLTKNFPDCKIRVLYEAGFRGFELHDKLIADGIACVVIPAHTVTQEKCSSQKNDRIDARLLAKNNENSDYKACHAPNRALREDRQVARSYSQLQKDIIRVCNRIRRTIEYHGLEEHFPEGSWNLSVYQAVEKKIKELNLSESMLFVFAMHFKELNNLREQRKEAMQQLKKLSESERYAQPVKLLQSAPGVGPLTAIRLVLEWGEMTRFKRKEAFSKFLGLIPWENSTGERERKGHITKQGNRQVRSWLIESAWIAIRYDPILLEKYRIVKLHCGSGKKAIVAVARKLAMKLRAVWLSGQPYQLGLEA
jgi:transposase